MPRFQRRNRRGDGARSSGMLVRLHARILAPTRRAKNRVNVSLRRGVLVFRSYPRPSAQFPRPSAFLQFLVLILSTWRAPFSRLRGTSLLSNLESIQPVELGRVDVAIRPTLRQACASEQPSILAGWPLMPSDEITLHPVLARKRLDI